MIPQHHTTSPYKMSLPVQLLHPDAKAPTRGTSGSAGYDLYAIADQDLTPGLNTIKLGIALAIPVGCYGRIADRSSMALKSLHIFAGVIDSDYRNEVAVIAFNHSDATYSITKHQRIAQLILEQILLPDVVVTDTLDTTTRNGGFGSTGK